MHASQLRIGSLFCDVCELRTEVIDFSHVTFINYISREAYSRGEMYIGSCRLCVLVSVCPSLQYHTTARTWM